MRCVTIKAKLWFSDFIGDFDEFCARFCDCRVHRVVIVLKGANMTNVVEGSHLLFEVQGFNKAGKRVPLTDATVGVDNVALGSDSVNSDGTGGDFAAGAATDPATSGNITARAAGIDATPVPVTVVADNAVATVAITFGA